MSTRPLTSTTTACTVLSMTTTTPQRVTLFVNPSLVKHARAQAIVEDITLTSLVEKALTKYLPKETIIKKSQTAAGY
ncbi:MAG: hypothetical protein ACD_22C00089G0003 [uncultured bacterium]|nr:MAG: hypothetical protein ACD_22C00089G0003 [uncultured bacterium]